MAFAFRKDALPEEFEAEHGTIDLTDDTKPGTGGAGGDDGEDEDLDLGRAKQRVWLCKVSRRVRGAVTRGFVSGMAARRVGACRDQLDASPDEEEESSAAQGISPAQNVH